MKSKYELLAPVGDFRNLKAAVEAGCDAVYFGVRGFNMRDSARNFSLRDLDRIRRVCSSGERNVKMYLTLNIVVYDGELRRVEEILKKVKGKVDAVICWDLAVIGLCKKYKIPFHVSTQASISNAEAAKFYKKLGAERVVLARELSLKQIKKISKIVEVECFCHGAMCVAVSGRCFMSQHACGLSANRGKCSQPCRRSWHKVETADAVRPASPVRSLRCKTGFACEKNRGIDIVDDSGNEFRLENSRVMSAKDLCSLPFVDKMKSAGITSFKIEGRNRGPEYVRAVVAEYRKAIDRKLEIRGKKLEVAIREGLENLKKVYHRGFSSGFYLGAPTADDFSFSEHGEQSEKKEFVGKVYKYWKRHGVCSVLINTGRLKVGDEVYLIGDKIGVKRAEVKSIELEGKRVDVAKKGDDIGVVFDHGKAEGGKRMVERVGSGTEVYVIRKK
jgi:putative protease